MLELVPGGLPVTRPWLAQRDSTLDRHAVDNLLKGQQLAPLAQGVYMRPGTKLTWEGVVCCLQNVLKTDLCVGGLTALELAGFAHYLDLSDRKAIHLYGKDRLPPWCNQVLLSVQFIRHPPLSDLGASGVVNDEYDTGEKRLYNGDPLQQKPSAPSLQQDRWPFTRSSPERAFLETLADVPDTVSFEHADQLMQGLTTLTPHRLEKLLRLCRSVKVRRLLYWYAERNHHAWFNKLPEPETLDELGLGSGNRVLAKGGKLVAKYKITVPEELWTPAVNTTDKSSF